MSLCEAATYEAELLLLHQRWLYSNKCGLFILYHSNLQIIAIVKERKKSFWWILFKKCMYPYLRDIIVQNRFRYFFHT